MEPLELKEAVQHGTVQVGRYEVQRLVGEGGMGDVYLAIDREHGGEVALKTLRDCTLAPERLLLFKNEFRAVADLSHKNLVPLYELGHEDGLWFFTMEHVDGVRLIDGIRRTSDERPDSAAQTQMIVPTMPTLAASPRALSGAPKAVVQVVAAETPACDPELFTSAVSQILDALEYLHQQGVVHQDLKPSNILVDQTGVIRVLDFGLAHRIGRSLSLHSRGEVVGTPRYMAPELWLGEPASPESDLFALGCIMFQLLSAQLPFAGRSIHVRNTPQLGRLVQGVPRATADICTRLLARSPNDRPSIPEVRVALGLEQPDTATMTPVRFVGRVEEHELLVEALDRVAAGGSVVACIEGDSGVGKTALIRSFLRGLQGREDVLVLRGRCYERESVPYKAFDGMVDELSVRLSRYSEEEMAALLPPWFDELVQVFPVLSPRGRVSEPTVISPHELRRRVLVALYQLLARLASQQPLVLEIDDLQWADADSMALLEKTLRQPAPGLLLVLSLRPRESAENTDVARYLRGVGALAPERKLWLSVGPLDPDDAQELARRTLHSLGLAESLALPISREAGGVPFFVEELVHSIVHRESGGTRPVRLEDVIAARAQALPAPERALVEVLAVANNPIPRSVACLAAGIEQNVLPVLRALHRGHFVQGAAGPEDRLAIYHDRIREAVIEYMAPERVATLHLALGQALAEWSNGANFWVFDAARHLHGARTLLSAPEQQLDAAQLHLVAARQARKAAAYPLAFRCFEDGIALLPDDGWHRDYETALGLHAGAAEAAYLTANWPVMDARIADVKEHANSLVDQMAVWSVQIDALAGQHQYTEAIEAGLEILGLLGVDIPPAPGKDDVGAAFGRALEGLTAIGLDGFAALPDAEDPHVLAAMRIQVRLCPVAFFVSPELLAVMACNLVTTSIDRGLSNATPNALALFGLILNTVGMFPVSHPWGQLAIDLVERWEDRSLEAATRHVVYNFVCPWIVPLREIVPLSRDVVEIGRRTGDLEYAYYSAHSYTYMAMLSGTQLVPLREDALELGAQMRSVGQVNAEHIHLPFEQLLRSLTGAKEEPWNLNDARFSEAEALAAVESMGARVSICVLHTAIGLVRFYFGRYEEASKHFELARPHLDTVASCWLVPLCHQFAALAGCACLDALSPAEQAALRPSIEQSLEALRALAVHGPDNFAHRVQLIEGELKLFEGDEDGAMEHFQQSMDAAVEGGWVCDIALTHSAMARCLDRLGRGDEAAAHRGHMDAVYMEWGASALVSG